MTTKAFYKCSTCGSTAEVINNPIRSGNLVVEFPNKVVCGWRGCTDFRIRIPQVADGTASESINGR